MFPLTHRDFPAGLLEVLTILIQFHHIYKILSSAYLLGKTAQEVLKGKAKIITIDGHDETQIDLALDNVNNIEHTKNKQE